MTMSEKRDEDDRQRDNDAKEGQFAKMTVC